MKINFLVKWKSKSIPDLPPFDGDFIAENKAEAIKKAMKFNKSMLKSEDGLIVDDSDFELVLCEMHYISMFKSNQEATK
jgi:hypothetical protein